MPQTTLTRFAWGQACWAITAAFGTYFCFYAFRKPFAVATYAEMTAWGVSYKTLAVTVQMLGYLASKFIGIRFIAEMPSRHRASAILIFLAAAELALLGYACIPYPYNVICLFFNGLPLGMIFGLVLGYLEGRRSSELLAAGLCASFISADGVVKATGALVLQSGISDFWMPCITGLLFTPPLLIFVTMLSRIPPPDLEDEQHRSPRVPMTRGDRWLFLRRHAVIMGCLVFLHLGITILRTMRSDFAPEIWRGMGSEPRADQFASTELLAGAVAVVVIGLSVLIRDNHRAFLAALATSAAGLCLVLAAFPLQSAAGVSPFGFMVLVGLGLYLPYVAAHTTLFERLIALTRDRANVGFTLYVADAIGYVGYVAVLLGREYLATQGNMLGFFRACSLSISSLALVSLLVCMCVSRQKKGSGAEMAV